MPTTSGRARTRRISPIFALLWVASLVATVAPASAQDDPDGSETSRSVSGTVSSADGSSVHGVCVQVESEFYYEPVASGCAPEGAGSSWDYSVGGLAPGEYRVQFVAHDPANLLSEWYGDASASGGATVVDVREADRSGIDAELAAGRTISGVVTLAQQAFEVCVQAVPVTATGERGDGVWGQTCIRTEDSPGEYEYTLRRLAPGDYKIEFRSYAYPDRVPSKWWDNAATMDEADVVTVPAEGPDPTGIDVALGHGAADPPGAPRDVAAAAGDGEAVVSWRAPESDGGRPIESYTVTASPGSHETTVDGSARSATVTGLTNGTSYRFTVTATNAAGEGPASQPSDPVVPSSGSPTPSPPPPSSEDDTSAPPSSSDDTSGTEDGHLSAEAGGGDTVTTDSSGDGATPTVPIETAITTPNAGTVSVGLRATTTEAPAGWELLHREVVIHAPPTTATDPLMIRFTIDGTVLPEDPTDVGLLRDGAPLKPCRDPGVAEPDPCLVDKHQVGDDLHVTVRTSESSTWSIGIADACPTGQVPEARFVDESDDNVHESAIDCATWWGIVQGRRDGSYGPSEPVSRGQMASFVTGLLRSAGLELPVARDHFDDDDGTHHEASINALAEAAIITGVGSRRFQPGGLVTRAQMATFLVEAYEHAVGADVPMAKDHFADDDGTAHESTINASAALGFTVGSADGRYHPRTPVRRDQMASFLTRAATQLVADGITGVPGP